MKKIMGCLMCVLLIGGSIAPAFALSDDVSTDATECETSSDMTTLSTVITDGNGGRLEYSTGLFNFWGKYYHAEKEHRVVLQTDSTYTHGAWEAGGPYAPDSYAEHKKGNSNVAWGEVK
jgi:hypothetical protein